MCLDVRNFPHNTRISRQANGTLMVRMLRDGVTSSTPMEKPRSPRKRAQSLDRRVMHVVA